MSNGYEDPAIPDIRLPGGGLEGAQPDALTPWPRAYEREAISRKFDVPATVGLLDTLDDPSALIPAVMERGGDLSVAEVILSEILATMRQRTHHQGDSIRSVVIDQGATGYTKVYAPSAGNQIVRVRAIVLAMDTGAGSFQFVHGSNGSSADAPLTPAMPIASNTVVSILTPNARENPVLFTSPGAILGVVSVSNKLHGWVNLEVSQGGES